MRRENFYRMSNTYMEQIADFKYYSERMLTAKPGVIDRVELDGRQLENFVNEAWRNGCFESEVIINPSLEEFELILTSEDYPDSTTKVIFKKTILPQTPLQKMMTQGITLITTPMLDVYVYFNSHDVPDVIGVVYVNSVKNKGVIGLGGTISEVICVHSNLAEELRHEPEGIGFVHHTIKEMKSAYAGIQNTLLNRKEVFVERRERLRDPNPHTSSVPAYRRVLATKKYVVRDSQFCETRSTGRTMQCPSWGVIGHWRNYKSGKSVWIAPYRKGRERNNLEAYSPKNYQI